MVKPRLHLDADASVKALVNALREHGHDVTRTPNDWMPVSYTHLTLPTIYSV